MYEIGEFIVYGSNGVCQVADISKQEIEDTPDDMLYYELKPVSQKNVIIRISVENTRIPMRRILTEEQARQLIQEMPQIKTLEIQNDKMREPMYKECVKSTDCRKWISIIETLHQRKIERARQGKRMTATDERYLRMAKDYLYGELSIPLGIAKNEVEEYISRQLDQAV